MSRSSGKISLDVVSSREVYKNHIIIVSCCLFPPPSKHKAPFSLKVNLSHHYVREYGKGVSIAILRYTSTSIHLEDRLTRASKLLGDIWEVFSKWFHCYFFLFRFCTIQGVMGTQLVACREQRQSTNPDGEKTCMYVCTSLRVTHMRLRRSVYVTTSAMRRQVGLMCHVNLSHKLKRLDYLHAVEICVHKLFPELECQSRKVSQQFDQHSWKDDKTTSKFF